MRSTDKANEFERMVTRFRADYSEIHANVTVRRARIESLIALRPQLSSLQKDTNNSLLCSMLYGSGSHQRQLSQVCAKVSELSRINERNIAGRFRRITDKNKLDRLIAQLPLQCKVSDGYTGYQDETGSVIPIYYLRYSDTPDLAGFVHKEYRVWFKTPKVFSTGFMSYPTSKNWTQVASARELLGALIESIREDGLIE